MKLATAKPPKEPSFFFCCSRSNAHSIVKNYLKIGFGALTLTEVHFHSFTRRRINRKIASRISILFFFLSFVAAIFLLLFVVCGKSFSSSVDRKTEDALRVKERKLNRQAKIFSPSEKKSGAKEKIKTQE